MESSSWENWKTVSLLVCIFAMVREIRPIEPFFTKFLTNRNFSLNQVNEEIYAVGTYSCLVLAVVIFLITDYFRYKPLIVADGIAGIFTYALLLGTPSLFTVQMEQVFFGFFYSSEVAFTTYLYAKVDDKKYYQKITSLVKASTLFGRFLSGLIAQTIVSTHLLGFDYLLYISIFSTSFVTIWSLFLPKVERSLYFNRNKKIYDSNNLKSYNGTSTIEIMTSDSDSNLEGTSLTKVNQMLLSDFQAAYRNSYVKKKCLWWIVAVTGNIIVATYIQVLWEDVSKENNINDLMNGAVESIQTLCGAAGAYAIGQIHYDWKKIDDILFGAGTLILALLLFLIYYCNTLWLLYVLYVIFGVCFHTLLTITTSEIAKYIKPDSYGLIFGFNLFMSLLVISIFTLLFIQGVIVSIGTKNQILTISLMFTSICSLLFILALKNWKK